jgi:zinc/manganese transport system permease protein
MDWTEILETVFNFENYGELLPLVSNSIIAGALLGLVGGLIGVFVMMRDMAFAVHGIAELSFAGAAFALLIGANVVFGSLAGSVLASLVLGLMGTRAKDRNSIIGILMPFGLGLGILFLALYEGRSANKFGLLTGQIVAVDDVQLGLLAACAVVVIVGLVAIWRPLSFVSVDPTVAAARGVPAGRLSVAFMLLLGLAVALSIQIVGALLVLSLLITPAAAALRLTARPGHAVVLSVAFAMASVVGGILLALAGRLPISPYVTTISFLIYVVCRTVSWRRTVRHRRREHAVAA